MAATETKTGLCFVFASMASYIMNTSLKIELKSASGLFENRSYQYYRNTKMTDFYGS